MTKAAAVPALDMRAMRRHSHSAGALLKALGNPHRLLILCVLADGERSVGELNELVALSQSALSQHLAVLREERLVTTRREAQTIFYRLAEGPAMKVIQVLHDHYCGVRG